MANLLCQGTLLRICLLPEPLAPCLMMNPVMTAEWLFRNLEKEEKGKYVGTRELSEGQDLYFPWTGVLWNLREQGPV